MKTETQQPYNKDFEPLYQAMEDDPKLLKEAFEIILEMINSDPNATKNIALLIKEEYHSLYKEITAFAKPEDNQDGTPSCCSGH